MRLPGRRVSTSAAASSSRNRQIDEAEEWDDADATATHFLALDGATPAATARLIAKGGNAKIGRVAVMPDYRGTGLGRDLMVHILTHAKDDRLHRVRDRGAGHRDPVLRAAGLCRRRPEYDDGSGIMHRVMRLALVDWPGTPPRLRESRSGKAAQLTGPQARLAPSPRTRAAVEQARVSAQNRCTCDISALMRAFVP
jgi:predicted GNAT family N-acyltransferase